MSPTVLLLVDFINPLDFPGADKLAPGAIKAALATARLKSRLEQDGAVSIYANDNYGIWRSEFHDIRAMCEASSGASGEIARALAPRDRDLAILKPRHSAFFGTPLDLMLTQMHTRSLVITGLAADICIQLSAMDASLRGYKLWIPADCTASESEQAKHDALQYVKRVLKADIRRSTSRRRL
ncbi:MAG TPA: isochorismatase family cysteine hydrolase [Ideonella sp.]|uniref:isochorismatase family cysteine hydrolase n=1 Tax=Ideonella sp. TaxID=1929293 RepID=UPI002E311BE5|nr:isochorismatase family cysteine hydrolase [Ideonella sp.]HEX5685995.1 isochorismatase family cysteine hydrolase [Ideonella sp.]